MIAINNNLSATGAASTLSGHYGRLQTSTQRLSSGLRINGAADDAAGLAIRELMRSDIAALRQGMRNVNDGISMLQTMDGALGVIDEKLIRMKELAEQAATGTYDSTQRLMIDSEFQAMGEEIDRIARATDFNGVHLLTAKMISWFEDEDKFVVTDPGSIANLQLPAGNNGNPVLKGINPAIFIDENTPAKAISVSLTAKNDPRQSTGPLNVLSSVGNTTEFSLGDTNYKVAYVETMAGVDGPVFHYTNKPADLNPGINHSSGWYVTDRNDPQNTSYLAPQLTVGSTRLGAFSDVTGGGVSFSLRDDNGNVNLAKMPGNIESLTVDLANNRYEITRNFVKIDDQTDDYTASYNPDTKTVTVNLKKGGSATVVLNTPLAVGDTINFDINLSGEVKTVPVEHHDVDPDQKLTIHFGPMNDSTEDYYDIKYANCTREGLGLGDLDIQTQDKAQNALVDINEAIVRKDKVRAYFGAMQNRLENTMTNLSIQAENLQAAESRISDADIAREMMNFVRNQILTQSAVAMLAQANSMPEMVMALITR